MTDDRKQAEEILEPYRQMLDDEIMYPFSYIRPSCALKAMGSYAALKVSEATKEMYPKELVGIEQEILKELFDNGDIVDDNFDRFYNRRKGLVLRKIIEVTNEVYPKDFVMWAISYTTIYPRVRTIDELFEYWKQNIQGK